MSTWPRSCTHEPCSHDGSRSQGRVVTVPRTTVNPLPNHIPHSFQTSASPILIFQWRLREIIKQYGDTIPIVQNWRAGECERATVSASASLPR